MFAMAIENCTCFVRQDNCFNQLVTAWNRLGEADA